jgi:hypothetical protein
VDVPVAEPSAALIEELVAKTVDVPEAIPSDPLTEEPIAKTVDVPLASPTAEEIAIESTRAAEIGPEAIGVDAIPIQSTTCFHSSTGCASKARLLI